MVSWPCARWRKEALRRRWLVERPTSEPRRLAAAPEEAGGDQIDWRSLGFSEARANKKGWGNQIELGASVEKTKAGLLPISPAAGVAGNGRRQAATATRKSCPCVLCVLCACVRDRS